MIQGQLLEDGFRGARVDGDRRGHEHIFVCPGSSGGVHARDDVGAFGVVRQRERGDQGWQSRGRCRRRRRSQDARELGHRRR